MSEIESTSSIRIYIDSNETKYLKKSKTSKSAFQRDRIVHRNEDHTKFPEVSSKYLWSEEPENSLKLNHDFASASSGQEFEKSIKQNVILDSCKWQKKKQKISKLLFKLEKEIL